MPKTLINIRKIHLNKVCRSCLTERGHLREIFSTKIPLMMESCASVQVSENDELPNQICVSCFHQIAKLYNFKKKMERSDRLLRNYIKQKSKLKPKEFSDILHRAVNDAEIEITGEDKMNVVTQEITEYLSDEDIPLSERCSHLKQKEFIRNLPNSTRKSKLKANRIIDTIIKTEVSDEVESAVYNCYHDSESTKNDQRIVQSGIPVEESSSNFSPTIFSDGPPPLVPLVPTKLNHIVEAMENITILKKLPENTPPLVPIKPISTINPTTIINVLTEGIEQPMDLKLQCSICNEEFSTVLALKQHRTFNCQTSGLQCNICKKEFKERKKLIGHLKGHMVIKDYGCKICGKCYPNPSTFRVHMRTHTGERPFKCQVCNKGFVRWAGVVGHMKSHNANKPYKCETCGKGFKISSNLERHKVLHSGILPFCCSYCGKTFSQSDNLQLHIRTYHTNERPYLCNECGKGFVSSTRLNRHMWVHTGYKPYCCKHCTKSYSNSNDLKNHERTHTGGISDAEKPHACLSCDMRFFHPCRLAKHMKTHERPFACSECPKTFSTEPVLHKHMANKHGAQIVVEEPVSVEDVYIQYQ